MLLDQCGVSRDDLLSCLAVSCTTSPGSASSRTAALWGRWVRVRPIQADRGVIMAIPTFQDLLQTPESFCEVHARVDNHKLPALCV